MPECRVAECTKAATASRGMCWAHYYRWRKYGDPRGKRPKSNADADAAMYLRIQHSEVGCWLYDSVDSRPPRVMRDGHLVTVRERVFSIEVAPVPPGFRLRSHCKVVRCVRPDHQRLVGKKAA